MSDAWPRVRLAEVLRYRKEFVTIDDLKTYKRPRVQLHAQGVVLRDELPGALIKTKSQQVCRAGEFLVAEIDAKHGGFGLVPSELDRAIVSSHYFLFEIDESKLDRAFLGWFSKTPYFREQVEAQGSTNYAAVRPAQVLDYEIPLPPLAEQRRIVARIDEAARSVESANELRCDADDLSAALEDSVANALFGDPTLKALPHRTLGDCAEIRAGVTLGRELRGKTVRLPYLRVANVQAGRLDLSVIKEIEIYEHEIDKWLLRNGDILLTEGGDWDKLGRGTVWREEIPHCTHQNHIFRLRVKPDEFDADFLAAYIGSPIGKAYFQTASKQTTNLASINQRQLRAFPAPAVPLDQQKRIVAELAALSAETASIRSRSAEVRAGMELLLPAILDRAFSGRL